jgi:excinuclease ABC subunit B
MELLVSDDPLAREVEALSPSSGREKGKHNKGVARHRTAEEQERFRQLDAARAEEAAEKAARPNLFRKPHLDEMGADGARPVGKTPPAKSLFAKPSLDDMGPGTDSVTPAGAVPRSLFKKQSAAEAHKADAVPDDTPTLFRKNSLDEMTVRRTEKPVEGKVPTKPQLSSPLAGEDSSPREAQPSGKANLVGGEDDPRPLVRARSGVGSYEEPRDTGRQKKRTGKTGRPGR